jgi:sugar O-acyltransferase (sialic acid O-acetyltransferase NeuD family)
MPIVVLGRGGYAVTCIDVLEASGLAVAAHLDPDDDLGAVITRGAEVFVALMDNRARQALSAEVRSSGAVLVSAVSPRAVVSPSAHLGAGALIMPGAVVNAHASIGDGAIVNTNAAVDYDVSIGSFAHVAVGASLAGGVSVGDGALIGVGASVTPGRTIGAWSTVGAGSAVVRDVPPGATVAGVPAKTTYGSAALR